MWLELNDTSARSSQLSSAQACNISKLCSADQRDDMSNTVAKNEFLVLMEIPRFHCMSRMLTCTYIVQQSALWIFLNAM